MKNIAAAKLFYRFLLLGGLSLCLWAVSARTKEAMQDTFVPVGITDQLPAKDGIIPVLISCGQARLSSPNQLEEFRCTLKNYTNLSITAANTPYSVVIEKDGSTTRHTTNSIVETSIHSDFKGENKKIGPGDEISIGPPGPVSYQSGEIIKSVEIRIDFIQFENGAQLGPDQEGSRIINAMRAGAKKYKSWLKQQYNVQGRSLTALASEIAADDSLPPALTDQNEQVGAKEYRRKFQKLIGSRGAADVKRVLESN